MKVVESDIKRSVKHVKNRKSKVKNEFRIKWKDIQTTLSRIFVLEYRTILGKKEADRRQ